MPATLRRLFIVLLALPASLAVAGAAGAAPSDLDTSYGTGGKTSIDARPGTVSEPLTTYDAQELPGGGVLVAGQTNSGAVFVAKYSAAGNLDASFGTLGLTLLDFGLTSFDEPGGIALDSLGRIVVAGRADSEAFLARLTTGGQLDTTFAGDGVIVHPTPGDSVSFADLAVDTDDGIYVATSSAPTTVRRYTAAGNLDTAFGISGVSTPQQYGDLRLAMDPGTRRVVIGGDQSGNSYRFARLQGMADPSPGNFDTSFSGDGQLDITSPAAAGTFKDLDIAADRTIAVVGALGSDGFTVIRLTAAGAPAGLDGDGVITSTATANPSDEPIAINAQTAGLYVVSGASGTTGGFHGAVVSSNGALGTPVATSCETGSVCTPAAATTLGETIYVVGRQDTGPRAYIEARVLSTGLLKPAFGGDGYATITRDVPWGLTAVRSALDASGTLTTFGAAGTNTDESSFLLRQTVSGAPLTSFGSNGSVVSDLQPLTGENTPAAAQASDGSWLVAPVPASGSRNVTLRRLTGSGLDGTFGVGGSITVPIAPADRIFEANALALDSEGRVLVVGESRVPGGGAGLARDAVIARVLPQTGLLDPNFNGGAPVSINRAADGINEGLHSVIVLSNGDLVAGGVAGSTAFVVHLDAAGSPKPGFGTAGTTSLPGLGTHNSGSRALVAADASGTLFAGMSVVRSGTDREVAFGRLTAAGALDPTFGTAGVATVGASDTAAQVLGAVTVDHAGRLVFVGSRTPDSGSGVSDSMIGRLTTTGQPDADFAAGGRVVLDLAGGDRDQLVSVHLPSRKILAVGSATDGATKTGRVVTVQLIGDAEPPTPTPTPTPIASATPTPTPAITPVVSPTIGSTITAPKRPRARKAFTLSGKATATGGSVRRVQVAIRQVKKGKCLWLRTAKSRSLKAVKPVRGACTKPVFLTAKGTTSWSLKLSQGLPAGTYEITSRATLSTGLIETRLAKGSNVRRVTVK